MRHQEAKKPAMKLTILKKIYRERTMLQIYYFEVPTSYAKSWESLGFYKWKKT